jgi:hypothetical protein
MVLRDFIRTIYHEVEIHESGAFERRKRETNVGLTDTLPAIWPPRRSIFFLWAVGMTNVGGLIAPEGILSTSARATKTRSR